MTRVTVDADMRRKLLDCSQLLELCDEKGDVLAKLVPSPRYSESDDWESLGPEPSDEEIEREIKAGDFWTTQELMDEIKKLNNK